jgi:molybdate/tungstate transport system ATP-binding protein
LGAFSLRDVSLEVAEGEYFVLLGPTGAGKSVLLEMVMGFHRPDKGRIILDGRDITDVPVEKRGIGYVPQNCPLFPHMSVFENVEFGLKMQRIINSERKRAVDGMLGILGLEEMADRTPLTLSGGERQKTVLARVLVTRPKIVLLDEPLTAIDAESSRNLREELKRINRELKVAIVHVTHDQIEAFSLGSKVAIIRNGQIVQVGLPDEVLSKPIDEFVARFLGYENIFHAKFVKGEKKISEVSVEGISIRLVGRLESLETTVAIRPEDIMVTTKPPLNCEKWNVLEGEVKGYMSLGPVVEVTLDAGLRLKVFVDKRSFLELDLAVGKRIYAGFKVDAVKMVSIR